MTLARTITAAAGIAALVAGAVFAGGAANAVSVSNPHVVASDFADNPAKGTPGWGYRNGAAPTSGPSGLTTSTGTELDFGTGTSAYGVSVFDFIDNIFFDDATSAASTHLGLGLYTNAAARTGYFEINSETTGAAALDFTSLWSTPWGADLTLAEIDNYLNDEYGTAVWGINGLGFGTAGPALTIQWIEINDVFYQFTPTVTATITPLLVTPAMLATTGITATFNGYVPGEPAGAFLITGDIDDPTSVVPIDGTFVADVNGVLTVHYVAPTATTPLGDYSIVAASQTNLFGIAFSVVAVLPVAPVTAPTALAATGQDIGAPTLAAALMLLLGAGIIVARRRGSRA